MFGSAAMIAIASSALLASSNPALRAISTASSRSTLILNDKHNGSLRNFADHFARALITHYKGPRALSFLNGRNICQ
jgi:hypothetical protein